MLLICSLPFYYDTCLHFDSEYTFRDFFGESKFTELSKFLKNHCQNKNALNTMGESNIPMHALIYWCGGETNIIHTIFFYLLTLLCNDIIYGNTLALWLFKQSKEIYGAPPPSLDDIKTEPELVILCVDALFFYITHIRHKTKFKRILAATVQRFHGSFL